MALRRRIVSLRYLAPALLPATVAKVFLYDLAALTSIYRVLSCLVPTRAPVSSAAMETGAPISYEVLEAGTPVYSSDGQQVGTVAHVLAVPEEDVFDGIVFADEAGALHHEHRFADADDVDRIYQRAVVLKVDAAACNQLPRPSANPAVIRDDPTEGPPGHLHAKLQRAWDLISGNY